VRLAVCVQRKPCMNPCNAVCMRRISAGHDQWRAPAKGWIMQALIILPPIFKIAPEFCCAVTLRLHFRPGHGRGDLLLV
jgi:hypothetical protein